MAAIYKKGQGYYTRLMTVIGVGLLVVMGAIWVWNLLRGVRIGEIQPVYIQAGAALAIFLVAGLLLYWLVGLKPKVVDFMIATEGEMKKVNWSTRREIMGSTWVVIGFVVFLSVIIFIADTVLTSFFQLIRVLD